MSATRSARVRSLLDQMTVEEKIGQLSLIQSDEGTISNGLRERVAIGQIGGVLNEVDPGVARELQWIDAQRPHEVYYWKAGPFYKWQVTGPATNLHAAPIDYLYAFWVMRYYRLYERYYRSR